MELNNKVDNVLTQEQKSKFQKENGRYKLLDNLIFIPVIGTFIGIYMESVIIVSICIAFVILLLLLKIFAFTVKNSVYEKEIIPIIVKEVFDEVLCIDKKDVISYEFEKSNMIKEYDKIKVENTLVIKDEKCDINLSKITVEKLNIEENDGVVDKDMETEFSGVFAYAKLPAKTMTNFRVLRKGLENDSTNIVKITNMDFDKVYNVFSQNINPVEVRNILSPGVMARILEFNEKINKTINFTICEDTLYIAIDYKNFLEFKGKGRKYVNEEKAKENINVLQIIEMFIIYIMNIYEK